MAGPAGGREMNGAAAGCVHPGSAGWRGVGPGATASLVPRASPSGSRAGARGREAPGERPPPPDPSQPFPHRGGQRRPRSCGDGRLPGARGRVGVVAEPGAPSPPFPACRLLPVGLGTAGHRARGLAWQRSEEREALLVGFARLL